MIRFNLDQPHETWWYTHYRDDDLGIFSKSFILAGLYRTWWFTPAGSLITTPHHVYQVLARVGCPYAMFTHNEGSYAEYRSGS